MEPISAAPAAPAMLVLIAEDSSTIRGYLRRTVTEIFGAPEIWEVGDGQGALEAVGRRPPGLLITDLHMPLLSGREFLRRAFELGQLEGVPVLVLSSSITPDLREEFASRANVIFLRKPATAQDIRRAISGS